MIQWSQRLKYSAQENWYGPWFNLQVLGACPQVFSPTEKQRKRHLDLGELPKGDYWWSPSSWWGPPTAAHEEWTEKASQRLPTPWPLPSGRMEAGICRKNLSFSLGTEPQQAPESWAGTSPLHWLLLLVPEHFITVKITSRQTKQQLVLRFQSSSVIPLFISSRMFMNY